MSGSAALKNEPNAVSREDLEAMFANLSLAHDAALKGIKTLENRNDHLGKEVKTLRSELDLTERSLKESEEELSKAHDENGSLKAQLGALHDECGKLEDKIADLTANPIGDDEIEDLARVRKLLKAGNVDAARDGLERMLDGIDGSWRTRAATVVVPGQGALL